MLLIVDGAATSRLVQPRKPSGKLGGGLGVKKLESKVDETLFEQAPAPEPEPVKPLPVAAAVQQEAEKPSTSSRFAYDTLTAQVCWWHRLYVGHGTAAVSWGWEGVIVCSNMFVHAGSTRVLLCYQTGCMLSCPPVTGTRGCRHQQQQQQFVSSAAWQRWAPHPGPEQ